MAQYVSGRQPFLNVGIPGITTNITVLDITGRVGIGTTNPSADLDLSTIRIRQSIFDATNSSGQLGYFLTNDASGIRWTAVPPDYNNALFVFQNGVISGFSSYTGLNFISDGNDLVAISTNSGNTNIVDIKINSYWNKDGNTGIYTSKFIGIGSTNPSVALDVIGNSRISGIVTIGAGNTGVVINAGIITSISGLTTLTFYGNLIGSASTASFATTAFNLDSSAASNLNVAYASTAGVSTDVVGGIASVRSLSVDATGISTLGTVKISSGIVTSNIVGVSVTYYGDGSKLTGVSGVKVEFQTSLEGDPVYPTLANSAGVSSVGIATTGNNALVFIPSNGRLGIGTTNPTEKLEVNGNIRLRSGLRDSTNQLGDPNSILSSDGSNVVWSSVGDLGGSEISLAEDNATTTPQYLIFTNAISGTAFTERVSPSKLSFIASSGSLGIGTSSPLTPLQVEKYGVKTGFGTFVASSGITTDVDSFLISNTNFKTAEYTVYIESSSSIQAQKVLVMQNGASAFSQEYAIMYEPTFMISIGATVSGGLCKLQFTPESGISGLMTYRFARETMI